AVWRPSLGTGDRRHVAGARARPRLALPGHHDLPLLRMSVDVTVAIPMRDGGEHLRRTLKALVGQTVEHELLVCDSGSGDGSVELARAHGARVLEIASCSFGHGKTRNLLM